MLEFSNVDHTYKTPLGSVPIIDLDKSKLLNFIKNIENNISDVFTFVSNPLCNSDADPYILSKMEI